MAQVLVNESSLEDIADAIREKTESTDTYMPSQMPGAIRSIRTGGDVTGVKGNAENSYRTGNVNLTPADIGVTPASIGALPASTVFVSSVKGNGESTYRSGQVNLTPANLGAKSTQTPVSDPTASGNTAAFIDTISQDAQGVITVTKKTVRVASSSQSGLMSATDKSKLDGLKEVLITTQTISEQSIGSRSAIMIDISTSFTYGYKLISAMPEFQLSSTPLGGFVVGTPFYNNTSPFISIYNPSSNSYTISGTLTCIWMNV